MNTAITFPPVRPSLKLVRGAAAAPVVEATWQASLAEERRRLREDQEELRAREANLREYETRLRVLQAEIAVGGASASVNTSGAAPAAAVAPGGGTMFLRPSSKTPFVGDGALEAAWERVHRASALIESEQANLRDERIMMREQEQQVQRRTAAVALREQQVAAREKTLATATAATPPPQPIAGEHTMAGIARLTVAPFAMARAVFGGKK
ncbi:MAG: hypothetical protein RLZZ15_1386 [Verrucomicrobiota bacterium]|jgi:hypothetical protein